MYLHYFGTNTNLKNMIFMPGTLIRNISHWRTKQNILPDTLLDLIDIFNRGVIEVLPK